LFVVLREVMLFLHNNRKKAVKRIVIHSEIMKRLVKKKDTLIDVEVFFCETLASVICCNFDVTSNKKFKSLTHSVALYGPVVTHKIHNTGMLYFSHLPINPV